MKDFCNIAFWNRQERAVSEIVPKKCGSCGEVIPVGAPEGLCPKCLLVGVAELTEPAGGQGRATPPRLEAVAGAFPHLEVVEMIGQGGMGCVFKARQPKLDRVVALKILPEALARDEAFAERFAREARALAALNHPNIVTIHDFGESGGFYFLLMEFVDGVNLRQALQAGRFTPEQALAVVPPICEALQFAHERGIVHRDIKPENLLLDKTGRVKIADFGIAKMVKGGGAEEQAFGSPRYAAPEQSSARADHRADIYSLGVVLYEMLTGEAPGARVEPPSRKVQVDVRLDEVVLRALERSPELRWQTAAEFSTRLQEASTSAAVSREAQRKRGSPWAVAGLCVPSALFIWFLLAGQLDADVRLWAGLFGFPLTAGLGLLLAWLAGGFASDAEPGARWSGMAIVSCTAWVVSVVLMGGGLPMLGLIAQEGGDWNAGWAELGFALIFTGGGFLSALAATLLGWAAIVEMRRQPSLWKGFGAAFPAKWFWPGVAIGIVLGLVSPGTDRREADMKEATLAQMAEVEAAEAMVRLESQPPVVVETDPVSGSINVTPGEREIRVRFSKPMLNQAWSWVRVWEGSAPEMAGEPWYVDDRTCAVKVRLEPGRTYAFWLNSEEFRNFQDRFGNQAVPYLLIFQTGGGPEALRGSGN